MCSNLAKCSLNLFTNFEPPFTIKKKLDFPAHIFCHESCILRTFRSTLILSKVFRLVNFWASCVGNKHFYLCFHWTGKKIYKSLPWDCPWNITHCDGTASEGRTKDTCLWWQQGWTASEDNLSREDELKWDSYLWWHWSNHAASTGRCHPGIKNTLYVPWSAQPMKAFVCQN